MKPGDFDYRWLDQHRVELFQPAGYVVIPPFNQAPLLSSRQSSAEDMITFNHSNSYLNFCAWKRKTLPYLKSTEITKRAAEQWRLLSSSAKEQFKKSSESHLLCGIFI